MNEKGEKRSKRIDIIDTGSIDTMDPTYPYKSIWKMKKITTNNNKHN